MAKPKANPGDVVDYKYKLGAATITGRSKVTQVVKYPNRPTSYLLAKGIGVRAHEITAVVMTAEAARALGEVVK